MFSSMKSLSKSPSLAKMRSPLIVSNKKLNTLWKSMSDTIASIWAFSYSESGFKFVALNFFSTESKILKKSWILQALIFSELWGLLTPKRPKHPFNRVWRKHFWRSSSEAKSSSTLSAQILGHSSEISSSSILIFRSLFLGLLFQTRCLQMLLIIWITSLYSYSYCDNF